MMMTRIARYVLLSIAIALSLLCDHPSLFFYGLTLGCGFFAQLGSHFWSLTENPLVLRSTALAIGELAPDTFVRDSPTLEITFRLAARATCTWRRDAPDRGS